MKLSKTTTLVVALALAAAPAFAKKKHKDETAPKPAPTAATDQAKAPAAAAQSDSTPAAIVAGEPITLGEVDASASSQLMRLRQQEYTIRSQALEGLIEKKLFDAEAAARNVSEADLVKTEIVDKSPAPTDDEVQKFYDTNKQRFGGKTFDQVKADITNGLTQQKQSERRDQFIAELQAKNDVKILLDPPRVAVSIPPGTPAIGPADAPVTIVEWSDYQCPFCRRAHPTVEQLLAEYKGDIRFVYRDYPLPFHQHAMPASEAAHCALDQGKFWEYHKNLFEVQGDLSVADLSKRASDVGLDSTAFSACLQSKKFDGDIQSSMSDGSAVGVTGTPAFFINGRMLVGAQPIEQFRQVINDELTRKGITPPSASNEPPKTAAKPTSAGTR
jgi:protein-disulfide isomerase